MSEQTPHPRSPASARFPARRINPTQPLVARLLRLRRPAFADVELSGHIFPVTYKAVDRRIAASCWQSIGRTRC